MDRKGWQCFPQRLDSFFCIYVYFVRFSFIFFSKFCSKLTVVWLNQSTDAAFY